MSIRPKLLVCVMLAVALAPGCFTPPGEVDCGTDVQAGGKTCECEGASSTCKAVCGDGAVADGEACDDGNTSDGDGCSAACVIEAGHTCAGIPSACASVCGDGVVTKGEACDDGNSLSSDGCSATCDVELGFECGGAPSICSCANNGAPCDDGSLCTQDDVCVGGACAGTPVICAPQDECHESGACDSATGACLYASKPDGTECADGACINAQCMQTQLHVTVYNRKGDPVEGAKVKAGGKTLTTDLAGKVVFAPSPSGSTVAAITAKGYTSAAITVDVPAGAQVLGIAHLLDLGERIPFNVATGVDVIEGKVRVAIPGDSVVDGSGMPVTGMVEMTVVPLDPSTDLELAPGAMNGLPQGGNTPVGLASVFMADISLWSGSDPVQLKPGTTATIEFTLPDFLQGAYVPGDQIDAWSFDLNKGLWVQEGTGTVGQSLADPAKLSWKFDAPHFTFWNADYFKPLDSCLRVIVKDAETELMPLAAVITVASLSNNFYLQNGTSNATFGDACIPIPSNDIMRITATHPSYPNVVGYRKGNDPPVYGTYPQIAAGPSVATCYVNVCEEVTLLMGRTTCIAGTVEDTIGNVLDNVEVIARYNTGAGPQSSTTTSDIDGNYCLEAPQGSQVVVQANYDANGLASAGGYKTAEKVLMTGVTELMCSPPGGDNSQCTPAPTIVPDCDATCATWANEFGDGGNQTAMDVAVDANGNIFIAGFFSGTMTDLNKVGDPPLTSTGNEDIYVAKLDPNGVILWAKSFGDAAGVGAQQATAIAIDSYGNPVIVGSFTSSVVFGPTTLTSVQFYDGFVTKLSGLDGSVVEARRFGGNGNQWMKDVIVDNTFSNFPDSLILIGDFSVQYDGAGDPQSPGYIASAGDHDIFVTRIFGNSFVVGTATYGGAGDDFVFHGSLDAIHSLVLTGSFTNSLSFGPSLPTLTAVSGADVYAVKLQLQPPYIEPTPIWAKSFGSGGASCPAAGNRAGKGIAFDRTNPDGTSGNVWFTGDFTGCIHFPPNSVDQAASSVLGPTDTFVAQLDGNTGEVFWRDIIRNDSWQHGSDITVDTDGNLLLTGTARGGVFFGSHNKPPVGQEDLFVAKLDTSGNYLWVSRYGGNAMSYAANPSIAVKPYFAGMPNPISGAIAVTGTFINTIGFDVNVGVTSTGATDVFVVKLNSVD